MRRLHLGIGAGAAVGVGLLVWHLRTPSRLGLDRPRVVVVAGDASVDAERARAAMPFAGGATLRTGRGNLCFSVRASRVCMGAQAEVRLTDLGAAGGGTLQVRRGTIVIASAFGEELRATLGGSGTVVVRGATIALEDADAEAQVRALDGSATIEANGRPPVVVAAPDCVGLRRGNKRPPAPPLENEERSVVALARRWQGSAGAVLAYEGPRGRVEVDGVDVGAAPAAVLLDEGRHTLVVKDAGKTMIDETLRLRPGQTVKRGG